MMVSSISLMLNMGVDEIFGPNTANIDLNHHICSQKVRSSKFENAKSNYFI